MPPSLKHEKIPQLEGWSLILILFLLGFFSYLFLFLIGERFFPSLSREFLFLVGKVPIHLAILAFCVIRFGGLTLEDFAPNQRDAFILVGAFLIEFWVFGMLIGSEGIQNDRHDTIREFPAFKYWVSIFIIVAWTPLLEETFFRRYFLEIQRQHHSTTTAVLITAGVSTLFHLNLEISFLRFLWHFTQGAFFSVVYVNSRLVVSVLVHAFVNALVFFLSR